MTRARCVDRSAQIARGSAGIACFAYGADHCYAVRPGGNHPGHTLCGNAAYRQEWTRRAGGNPGEPIQAKGSLTRMACSGEDMPGNDITNTS